LTNLLTDVKDSQFPGYDCASKKEIKSVLQMGVPPKDIIFSNPVKIESDIEYAYRKGVRITTADTMDELIKI
jgi:ornithine decarboxylase